MPVEGEEFMVGVIRIAGVWYSRQPDGTRAPLQKTRLDFWLPKPEGSRLRDKRELGEPDAMGWEALVLCWVCDLRVSNLDWVARPVISFVDSGEATT